MRIPILLLLVALTISCSEKGDERSEKIITLGESEIKSNLKAPDSYKLKEAFAMEVWSGNNLSDVTVIIYNHPSRLDPNKRERLKASGMSLSGYRASITYSAINSFNAPLQYTAIIDFDTTFNFVKKTSL